MNKVKTIVIGITGGIAAYKALDVVSKLKKLNYNVHVIMTSNAQKFVAPLSFQTLSQNMVATDMFQEAKSWEIEHISLAKKADMILIAPASANIIGKIANGICDDILSTTIMAAKCHIVFAPAMNSNMYENQILQSNIEKLKANGFLFIEPQVGRLACGDVGKGKLADPSYIIEKVEEILYDKKDLIGKKVLVTAGPTIACIDPVRYITNRSSGKMGYAIAKEAKLRGAQVTLISGPTNLKVFDGIKLIDVKTTEEMLNRTIEYFENSDIVIKSAAVADYKPENYSQIKIKKNEDEFDLRLVKDTDILKKLGSLKTKQILIGFAAESNDLIQNAKEKLHKKNLDYILANDITSSDTGFASDDNKVTIIYKDGSSNALEKMSKTEIARKLFDIINK